MFLYDYPIFINNISFYHWRDIRTILLMSQIANKFNKITGGIITSFRRDFAQNILLRIRINIRFSFALPSQRVFNIALITCTTQPLTALIYTRGKICWKLGFLWFYFLPNFTQVSTCSPHITRANVFNIRVQ